MSKRNLLAALIAVCFAWSATAFATGDYSGMVVFGDSLSDVGNNPSSSGYATPRWSNGNLWVDYLASDLSLPALVKSSAGGNDYAFAGSQTSGGTGLGQQVSTYLGAHTPDTTTLYVLWSGGNDLIFGAQTDASIPAQNVADAVTDLYSAGARKFLVMYMPPLGYTPGILGLGEPNITAANTWSATYNSSLSADLAGLLAADSDLILFDTYTLLDDVHQNPGSYGFTNVTEPAMNLTGINPSEYLFWDAIHPTTAGHSLLAQSVYDTIVPEPTIAGYCLLTLGLALTRRRQRG